MHNAIPKTMFERMMNLLMKLALVALVETTVVVSEKKEKKRSEKASVSRCKGCCLAFVQYFEFLQFTSPQYLTKYFCNILNVGLYI